MSSAELQTASSLPVRNLIDQWAVTQPDAVFFVDPIENREVSFLECRAKVRQIAAAVFSQGVKPGDAVAYGFSNSNEAALVILGLLYGGYLATAINLVAGESTIDYVLEHSEAKLVIADVSASNLLNPILGTRFQNLPMVLLNDLMEISSDGLIDFENIVDVCDGLLMYTSGTTGRPKGVVHTQDSLLYGGYNSAQAHQLTNQDRGLCVLPFYHINAFCVSLMGTLVSGSSLVIPPKFSVSSFWKLVEEHGCSWFSVVPTQISYLLHDAEAPAAVSNKRQVRFGRSASAPLSPEMHAAFEERFGIPIIETMGLTETAAQILANPLPPSIRKIGSPGIAFGNEVVIGDENQREKPIGEEGEILVRGPNVLRCYLKNPEATREAITKDGWLRTGDLGRMDEDGYVYVTGRLKELIIKGGENIAPREVDEALYCHPDVIEAAAFAVPCKDYGQRVEAGVKLSDGSLVTKGELLLLCQNKLGAFKSPDAIHVLPDLPKGPSGKIQRIKLAEMLA